VNLKFLLIIYFFLSVSLIYAQVNEEQEDLTDTAEELFYNNDFERAMPLYSQLLSLYPTEPKYSFYYGACLVENNKEINKAIKYLSYASKKLTKQPLVFYYLGSAYHLSYQFDKAISQYQTFQNKSTSKQQKEKQIEREINICNNGLDLVKYVSPLIVLDNKRISPNNFQYSYDLNKIGGKLVIKPDQFKTKADIKAKQKELIFISDSGIVLFSSFGDKKNGDKNIFWTQKDSTGEFLPSQNIGDIINTPYDEAYPFLKSDGKTLFFCSKGHNTMGGYDIFKSVYDSTQSTWSDPINLDFPINTPYDDILYVVDAKNELAYFSSNRESQENKINVYKIQVDKNPVEKATNSLEEIQEIAKLQVTPLADINKNNDNENNAIATTEVANYESKGPKTDFSFESIYEKNITTPEDYTSLLRVDIKQLKANLTKAESKIILATNIAHQKLGKLRELQSKIETLKNSLPEEELSNNKELQDLINTSIKINTQASISAKTTEVLSKEILTRKREIKISEMLLNDSTNNNKQELVQNINANRKFLQENNKTYLSINNWTREKEREKTLIDKKIKDKKITVNKNNLTFQNSLANYNSIISSSKSNNNTKEVVERNQEINNAKDNLLIAQNIAIQSQIDLAYEQAKAKQLNDEILFLNTINSEISNKRNQQLANNNKTLDQSLIIQNAKKLNDEILAIRDDKIELDSKFKYEERTSNIFAEENNLLAENKIDNQENNNQIKVNNTDSINIGENDKKTTSDVKIDNNTKVITETPTEANSNNNDNPKINNQVNNSIDIKTIASIDLVQINSLEARKIFQEAKQDAQLSDSLASLANEKEKRVNFIPNIEQQEITKNEIEELKQLSQIKSNQSKNKYSQAGQIEQSYIAEYQTDTIFGNLIKNKIFEFETSTNDSPELIEYKKAAFKEQYYQQKLEELQKQSKILTQTLVDNQISTNTRNNLQTQLNSNTKTKQELIAAISQSKETLGDMKEILISNKESFPISKEEIYAAATEKQLNPKITLDKKDKKILDQITKERINAQKSLTAWEVEFKQINILEDSITNDKKSKEEVSKLLEKNKKVAWDEYKKANELNQAANFKESRLLTSLLDINRRYGNSEESSQAYVFEKESEVYFNKAANLRESIKITEQYNPAAADVLQKANLYETISINRQKSALDIYTNIPEKTDTQQEEIVNKNVTNNPITIELLPNEEEKISEYQKLYTQSEAKNIKANNYLTDISESKSKLDKIFSKKEQEKLNLKIKKQELKTKEILHEAFLIKQKANNQKQKLYQEKTQKALDLVSDHTKKAIAKQYLLDADFYFDEAQKIKVDSLTTINILTAQQNKKDDLEQEALKSQELAYLALTKDDNSEFLTTGSLIKIDPLESNEKPIDKSLIQKIQSRRIIDKLELSPYEAKQLTKVEKLKEEKLKLNNEYIEIAKLIKTLNDSLPQVTDPKQWEKMDKQISELEAKSLGILFNIAATTEPINYEKYMVYKNHIKTYRINGREEKAVTGHTLEKEANKTFRKAQNLRARSFDVVSVNKAYEMLNNAGNLEEESLDEMEKAYTIYMGLKPLDEDVKNYIAENTDTNKVGIHGNILVESEGQVEAYTLPEKKEETIITNIDSNQIALSNNDSIIIDTLALQETPIDTILIADATSIPSDSTNKNSISNNINRNENTDSHNDIETLENNSNDIAINNTESVPVITPTKNKDNSNNPPNTKDSLNNTELNKTPIENVIAHNTKKEVNNSENTQPSTEKENDNNLVNETAGSTEQKINNSPEIVSLLEIKSSSIYNKKNPIPINKDLPSGIIYKIQIGAFTKPIPENSFRGLTPITGETRQNSKYIRYFVGLFNTYDAANTALPFIQNSGYKDAFVVAYKDGQRIAVYLAKKENKQQSNYQELAQKETAIVLKTVENNKTKKQLNTKKPNPSIDLANISETMYTVQVGAYKTHVSHTRLKNLMPLYNDVTNTGLIRYFVGKYVDYNQANQRKNEIRQAGIKDAFVTAFKNGKKISINQARKELASVNSSTPTKTPTIKATAKTNTENNTESKAIDIPNLYYKVQIGAYSNSVPVQVVSSFVQMSKLDQLEHFINKNGKTVYTIGRYKSLKEANILKQDLIEKGIRDAFIIAYDGKNKISIEKAQQILNP